MEQRIEWVGGTDFPICTDNVNKLAQKLNEEGFKLTFVTTQSQDNQPYKPTDAMLVFTKE